MPEQPVNPRLTPDLDRDHWNIVDESDDSWHPVYNLGMEQEIVVDIRGDGHTPDMYWAEGWSLGFQTANRTDITNVGKRDVRSYPARYRVADFALSKSLRRVLNQNVDLLTAIRPLRITPALEELNYQHRMARFGRPPKTSLTQHYHHVPYWPAELMELVVFSPQGDVSELIAFTIFELGSRAMNGNLAVWAPGHEKRSLGTYTFLKEIEFAACQGFDYYYIGNTDHLDPSFSYKLRFPAIELYDWDRNVWVRREQPRFDQMLVEEVPSEQVDMEAIAREEGWYDKFMKEIAEMEETRTKSDS